MHSPVHLVQSFNDVYMDKNWPLNMSMQMYLLTIYTLMTTRSVRNNYKSKIYKSYTATKHLLFDLVEPTCVFSSIKDPNWRMAMSEEFNSLVRHGTWDLVTSSLAKNINCFNWVFRLKRRPEGPVEKYKVLLVMKGFHRRASLDYMETFSPIVKPVTIRSVLSIVLMHNWKIHQLNTRNTFLHGSLSEVVFMHQPPDFVDSILRMFIICDKQFIVLHNLQKSGILLFILH